MYKVIFTLVLAVASLMGLHAQEFQGMAVYESKPVRRILIANGGQQNMTQICKKMKRYE
jgi:hypothetical protein